MDELERVQPKASGRAMEQTLNKCKVCGDQVSGVHTCKNGEAVSDYVGKTVNGTLQILNRVGEGGTCVVYKALDTTTNKNVAIKMVKPGFAGQESNIASFEREAMTAGHLKHPGIVQVHEFVRPDDAEPFLKMEYIEGESLESEIEREFRLPLERIYQIVNQVCDGVAYAHKAGIVHLDLKPSNILLQRGKNGAERVKIVDFGISRLMGFRQSESGSSSDVLGSPMYMSPEQCAAKPLDLRSDIYSMACVIFEMLAGEPPFISKDPHRIMEMHVFDTPRRVSLLRGDLTYRATWDAIMYRALAKHPARRHQTMTELKVDLASI